MADIKVKDLTTTNSLTVDTQIMVLTNEAQNTVQNITVENLLSNVVSSQSANGLVISNDKKLYVDNANTGVTAGTYPYPSSVTVNSKGKITDIVAGTQGNVPVATPTTLGVVKPDNDTILIDVNGVLTTSSNFINKSQVTNCAIDVPHRVNYTCSEGTFTIKAGSVLVVPYGTTDQSSTVTIGSTLLNANFKVVDTQYQVQTSGISTYSNTFFVWVEVQNDISATLSGSAEGTKRNVYVRIGNNTIVAGIPHISSGSAPAGSTFCYRTDTNVIQLYSNGSVTASTFSLPICVAIDDGSYAFSAVDNVYKGIHQMGNVVFVDKGITAICANGFKSNGSINNVELTTEKLLTIGSSVSNITMSLFLRKTIGTNTVYGYLQRATTYLGELKTEPPVTPTSFQYYFNTSQMKWFMHNSSESAWYDTLTYYICSNKVVLGDSVYPSENYKNALILVDETALNEVKNTLANSIYVTDSYINGTSWYRIWSDGWCEQGGEISAVAYDSSSINLTFLKAFRDANYNFQATTESTNHAVDSACYEAKSATGVRVISGNQAGANVGTPVQWIAFGYIY